MKDLGCPRPNLCSPCLHIIECWSLFPTATEWTRHFCKLLPLLQVHHHFPCSSCYHPWCVLSFFKQHMHFELPWPLTDHLSPLILTLAHKVSKANDSWIAFSALHKAFSEVSYFTNRVIPVRLPSGHDLFVQVFPINILQMLRNRFDVVQHLASSKDCGCDPAKLLYFDWQAMSPSCTVITVRGLLKILAGCLGKGAN